METIAPPSVLTQQCYVSKPPTEAEIKHARERYRVVGVMSDWEARFLLMSDHWLLQTDAIGACNKQLKATREWVNKHRGLEKPHETLGNSK